MGNEVSFGVLKTCRSCKIEAYTPFALLKFVKNHARDLGYENICLACRRAYNNTPAVRLRTKVRSIKLNYGCTLTEYEERMGTSAICECCGSEDKLCYDHDHDTGRFRGVLCISCNKAIGTLGDDLTGVGKAVLYLAQVYEKNKY